MEQKDRRVGVFTRIYRNDDTMHEAIQSVLNQTYSNFKFYIMVNETTKKIILEWAKKDSRIKLIDGGINDGFKTCAKEIAAENLYVTTIDADDWYDVNYLADLIEQIENKKVDMVACGNYYFTGKNHIVGERKQGAITWEKSKTSQVLPFIYGHFRTIWGKLITAELLLRSEFNSLPDSTKYGGYGGDTLFMFNLLSYANRIAITDKSLYYYRVSESSGTYRLNPGRLDADEIVYDYVENVLKNMGPFGDNQRRYLLWIYGNALIDTINLLLHTDLTIQERNEKLLYIFNKNLTKELFDREEKGFLEIPELGENKKYAPEVYQLIFMYYEKYKQVVQIKENLFEIFEIIWPSLKNILSMTEFDVLLKSKKLLDAFATKKFSMLTEMLLVLFRTFNEEEKQESISVIKKVETDIVLKKAMCDVDFVREYAEVLRLLCKKNYEEAFHSFHKYFAQDKMPEKAEELVDIWITLAAFLENVSEFVEAKQFKVEILIKTDNIAQAKEEYNELLQLGIMDQNMLALENLLGEVS